METIFLIIGLNFSFVVLCLEGVILVLLLSCIFLFIGLMGSYNLMMNFMTFGGDLSSFMLSLLSIWISIMVLQGSSISKHNNLNIFISLILMILCFLVISFLCLNLLLFYIFFELVLIPMFILIMMFGPQGERLESGIYMLFYTIFGSLPLLLGLVMMYNDKMTWLFPMMSLLEGEMFKYSILLSLAFLIKLPMYGFHIWLPKAHVEAPVGGSMILAGVLLKLGGYGLFRVMSLVKFSFELYGMFISIGMWGGIVSGSICLRQVDMKKLIAYSSVVHMGLLISSIFTVKLMPSVGILIMSVSHGLCSSGLFYLVNVIYSRINSRSMMIGKGILVMFPSLSLWGFLLMAGNSAAPPFLSIFGEVFMMMGLLEWTNISMYLLGVMFFISVSYMIYFFSLLSHGKNSLMLGEIKVNEYTILFYHVAPLLMLILKLEMFFWV